MFFVIFILSRFPKTVIRTGFSTKVQAFLSLKYATRSAKLTTVKVDGKIVPLLKRVSKNEVCICEFR
jgi:hypothetical protein